MRAGDTRARFDGTVVPNRLDNVDGSLTLQGRDLSQLYPIVPVPFPWTPPYRLSGQLKHVGKVWTFRDFTGKVGDSDLAGSFALDVSRSRNRLPTPISCRRASITRTWADSWACRRRDEPPSARTAAQNKEAAKRELSERVLPTRPYDVDKFRVVDAKSALQGQAVSGVESAARQHDRDTRAARRAC